MRISTPDIWSNALNNLTQAQVAQQTASDQVSTQKIATDLEGYGSSSEVIAAYQSTLARTNGYVSVTQTVSNRLTSQDLALTTTSGAASSAKDAIMSSLSSNDGTSLILGLQGAFSAALNGLNYQYNGQYLFGGGNDNTPPVSVTSLSQLGAMSASTAATVFVNGSVKKTSTVGPNTTVTTGMLASDLGKNMMQTFQDIQKYNDDPATGPFGNPLTAAQQQFLTTKSQELTTEYNALVEQTSLNGTNQNTVTNTQTSLQSQADSMTTLIGNKTDADMATAYSNLQQAQQAVTASAQILAGLKTDSLLNILPVG